MYKYTHNIMFCNAVKYVLTRDSMTQEDYDVKKASTQYIYIYVCVYMVRKNSLQEYYS